MEKFTWKKSEAKGLLSYLPIHISFEKFLKEINLLFHSRAKIRFFTEVRLGEANALDKSGRR